MARRKRTGVPYISIVIPAYNASVSLVRLFASLKRSTYKSFEVIVGDDASFEPMEKLVGDTVKRLPFPVLFTRLRVNTGPAGARNMAAAKAKGEILVFLDSDVEVYPDTIGNIAKLFKGDDDLTAVTGVWDKIQRTKRRFPQFKALRDWSYWTNERDRDGYYYLFSTRIAAIRRTVFTRLKGFNIEFRQMEDVEITYRIARRYAIIFAPHVTVHHEFEGLTTVAKKYFWRSYYWTKLYKERKKFDPVATTFWESLTAITGAGSVMLLGAGSLLFVLIPFDILRVLVIGGSLFLFSFHLLLLRKFLIFVYKERGLEFMLYSIVYGIVLYVAIVLGAGYSFLNRIVHK